MSTSNGHHDSQAPERGPLKPPHRRLVVMFDGTGNKRLNLSNVARMFEAIDDSKPGDYEPYIKVGRGVPSGKSVVKPDREDVYPDTSPVQLVKYIKGVGTDKFFHLSGLGFGYGLSANVIAGYVWLSNHYHEGDEIFVFGFSRGAFSARSLVSLVHRCGGVLKKESVADETHQNQALKEDSPVVVKAYDMYQAYVQTTTADGTEKTDPAWQKGFYNAWQDFKTIATKDKIRIQSVTVKMLGVWDTVGAVGLPETGIKVLDDLYPLSEYGSKQYQFHGQGLSCIVENAYHALAIDEHRKHFAPTLWDKVTPENKEVKQVWFAGSHCNVGGGADLDDLNDPDDLWQYSYVWMQNHAIKHGLRFYWTYNSPPTRKGSSSSSSQGEHTHRVSLRKPEDSYAHFLGGFYKCFCNPFHREAKTKGAKLHWSVTDRLKLSAKQGESHAYRPRTLFGQYGTRFTNVAPDVVEIHKLEDIKTDEKKTPDPVKWQIETEDAEDGEEAREIHPSHRLKSEECKCKQKVVAPAKQSGFWSWFRSWFGRATGPAEETLLR